MIVKQHWHWQQTHNKWLTLLPDESKAVRDEGLWNSFPRFLVDCWLGWLGGTFSSSPVTKKAAINTTTSEKNLLKQLTKKFHFCTRPDEYAYRAVANWIGTLSKSGSENLTQKQDSRCFKFHRSYFNSSSLSQVGEFFEELNSKGLYLIPQKKEEIVVVCSRLL